MPDIYALMILALRDSRRAGNATRLVTYFWAELYLAPYRSSVIPLFVSSSCLSISLLYYKAISILMHDDVLNYSSPHNISNLFSSANVIHTTQEFLPSAISIPHYFKFLIETRIMLAYQLICHAYKKLIDKFIVYKLKVLRYRHDYDQIKFKMCIISKYINFTLPAEISCFYLRVRVNLL